MSIMKCVTSALLNFMKWVDLGVEFAEATAMKRGLKLALEKGYRELIVESDCLKVVNAINTASPLLSYLELLIQEIVILSHAFSNISFNHVFREANKVAHNLAKVPINGTEQIWMGSVPSQIISCINSDILSAFFE